MLKNPLPWLLLLAVVLGAWLWMVLFRDVKFEVALPAPLPPASVEGWVNTSAPLKKSDIEGKWVVVDYWATWCGPCVASFPEMVRLRDEWKDKGLVVVGITSDTSAEMDKIKALMKKINGFDWPVAYGGEEAFALNGVSGIPHIDLFNPEGKRVWNGHPAQLEDILVQHIGGGTADEADTETTPAATF
jgi:thiol-disulfide isomerase/thioredoxin